MLSLQTVLPDTLELLKRLMHQPLLGEITDYLDPNVTQIPIIYHNKKLTRREATELIWF